MRKLVLTLAMGMLLMSAFSGCVGTDKKNDVAGDTTGTPDGSDSSVDNGSDSGASGGTGSGSGGSGGNSGSSTGNQTGGNQTNENQTNGNQTENGIETYTENASGTILIDPDGLTSIVTEMFGVTEGSYSFTLEEAPEKLELILNYTSVLGDLIITLTDADGNILASSETDGGGTEIISLEKTAITSCDLTVYIQGGLSYYDMITVQADYKLTVMSYGAPIKNFAPVGSPV